MSFSWPISVHRYLSIDKVLILYSMASNDRLLQIKCKNVIILTATNALELDEEWNCLIELMTSDDVLLMMQSFVSKHLTTNLTDVCNSVFHDIVNILSLEILSVYTHTHTLICWVMLFPEVSPYYLLSVNLNHTFKE